MIIHWENLFLPMAWAYIRWMDSRDCVWTWERMLTMTEPIWDKHTYYEHKVSLN